MNYFRTKQSFWGNFLSRKGAIERIQNRQENISFVSNGSIDNQKLKKKITLYEIAKTSKYYFLTFIYYFICFGCLAILIMIHLLWPTLAKSNSSKHRYNEKNHLSGAESKAIKNTYIFGKSGVDFCPKNYFPIFGLIECKYATKELNLEFYTDKINNNGNQEEEKKISEKKIKFLSEDEYPVCNLICENCEIKNFIRFSNIHGSQSKWICKNYNFRFDLYKKKILDVENMTDIDIQKSKKPLTLAEKSNKKLSEKKNVNVNNPHQNLDDAGQTQRIYSLPALSKIKPKELSEVLDCANKCPVEYPVWEISGMVCLKQVKRENRCYLADFNCQHRFANQTTEDMKECIPSDQLIDDNSKSRTIDLRSAIEEESREPSKILIKEPQKLHCDQQIVFCCHSNKDITLNELSDKDITLNGIYIPIVLYTFGNRCIYKKIEEDVFIFYDEETYCWCVSTKNPLGKDKKITWLVKFRTKAMYPYDSEQIWHYNTYHTDNDFSQHNMREQEALIGVYELNPFEVEEMCQFEEFGYIINILGEKPETFKNDYDINGLYILQKTPYSGSCVFKKANGNLYLYQNPSTGNRWTIGYHKFYPPNIAQDMQVVARTIERNSELSNAQRWQYLEHKNSKAYTNFDHEQVTAFRFGRRYWGDEQYNGISNIFRKNAVAEGHDVASYEKQTFDRDLFLETNYYLYKTQLEVGEFAERDSWFYPEGKNKKCESQFQIESTFCKEWLNINQFDCEYMCVKLLVPNKCDLKNDQEFLKNDTENLEKFTKCKAFTWDSENLICKMFTECGEIEETLKPIFVYVLKLAEDHRCPTDGITGFGHRDGFGATFSAMISTWAYTNLFTDQKYCWALFSRVAHVKGYYRVEMWDFIGGFRFGFGVATANTEIIHDEHGILGGKQYVGDRSMFQGTYGYYRKFGDLGKIARINYFSTPKPKLIYDKNYFNLAIHLRRGDILQGLLGNNRVKESRYISEEFYVKCVEKSMEVFNQPKYMNKHRSGKILLHVFSEGTVDQFPILREKFDASTLFFHLDIELRWTFHHLVMADAITSTESTFSRLAAYYSSGAIINMELVDKLKLHNNKCEIRDGPDLLNTDP